MDLRRYQRIKSVKIRIIRVICVLFVFIGFLPSSVTKVSAQEKVVVLEWDGSDICCAIDKALIIETLEKTEGVDTAYMVGKGRLKVYYDENRISVSKIMEIVKRTGHVLPIQVDSEE